MNKIAVALLALTLVTISTVSRASNNKPAQTRCAITEATAPGLRGLRLGMSVQQLLDLFPGVAKRKELKEAIEKAKSATAAEVAYLAFDPATDGDAQRFAGVDSISAGLFKARVVDLSLQYGGATWRNVDEWIARLSETFKLPSTQHWTPGPNEAPNKVLRCDGVMIEAAIQGGSSTIRISSTLEVKEADERAKAAEEKRRKDVKP